MAGGGKRLWVICAVCLTSALAGAGLAFAADPIPDYEGDQSFPPIQDSAGPEEFSWHVVLGSRQSMRLLDDQHVVVENAEGHLAMEIFAEDAHDAVGASVPTTLAVAEGDVLTLTVHHRAGNPAANGAPFDYPVNPGAGWEGGFQSEVIQGPPDERQLREARERDQEKEQMEQPTAEADFCVVPRLKGLGLRGAQRRLRAASCRIGSVHHLGSRHAGPALVARQSPTPGRTVPAGTAVSVALRSSTR
jgi:hypothetical protein